MDISVLLIVITYILILENGNLIAKIFRDKKILWERGQDYKTIFPFYSFWKNGPTPASFHLFIFQSFSNEQYNFYNKSMWKKCPVHPVYGAGIWTHDLLNMSRLP